MQKIQSIEKYNDNVYLNIIFNHPLANYPVTNTLAPSGEQPIIAIYNVTKTIPIVDKASDYYCSVIRFTIPLDTIPIMIMPIIPATTTLNPQPNSNLTPFIIGIFYNGVYTPISLIYRGAHPNSSIPVQNIVGRQVITPYYFVYSYNLFINMINYGLQQALDSSGVQALVPGVKLAWFSINDEGDLIYLYVHRIFTDYPVFSPAVTTPLIYVNTALRVYIDAFNYNFYGYDQINGFDFSFILQNLYPVVPTTTLSPTPDQAYGLYNMPPIIAPATIPTYNIFRQEYASIQNWSSLRKILIISNTIPIAKEFEPPILYYSDSQYTEGTAPSFPILSDYIPQLNNIGESRSVAYYIPTSQYRLIDLISDQPIFKVDLNIYWQDKQGNTYPLDISLFEQASVKLAFIHKSVYKSKANTLLLK
jgi:hypothetical protein